jgi:hypothetical protein
LSLSIQQTSWLVSLKPGETVPIPVSHINLQSDLNVSLGFHPSVPINHSFKRWSREWSPSDEINLTILRLQSRTLGTTPIFFSNPLLTTHSDIPSILSPTAQFLTLGNNQLKVSLESVRMTSGAAGGGALIALITIFGLFFVLNRRHNSPQTEGQIIDECDLPTEHSEPEEFDDEDEDVFDLVDVRDGTNSNALSESETDHWVPGRIRPGDDLGMHFDGEESF